MDVLQPLCYRQIQFPKIDELDDSKPHNKDLIRFATDYQSKIDLIKEIGELKKYFEENGGNVPFCRATLNPNTAVKNPESSDTSIEKEIAELGLKDILKNYESELYYENYLENLPTQEKLRLIKDNRTSKVTHSLLFKYNPLPAIIQFEIAKTLSQKIGKSEESLLDFLREIGQAKSPAKDYADLDDKTLFNLEAYPLKVGFDFAWETLAKAKFHNDADLPIYACAKFLENNFNVQDNNPNLILYAQLQELNAILSTLEHGNPTEEKEFEKKAKDLLNTIDWGKVGNSGQANKVAISAWLAVRKKKDNFNKAKQQIGLFRGRLKNQIKKFDDITKINKDTAMEMGRTFATMRDKITGAAELNKVTHYAMIIEDYNQDRYVLLQEFTENESDRIYKQTSSHSSDEFITYCVNSVTSNAIAKMLRKKRLDEMINNNNAHYEQPELTEEEKEQRNIKEWKAFIEEKHWDWEFKLNLKDKNFEQIKKEVDSKCYKLDDRNISKAKLETLVKEKGCLLLPIVNQDLAKETKTDGNQFTKDWNAVFAQNSPWRLTPEFRVSYRDLT